MTCLNSSYIHTKVPCVPPLIATTVTNTVHTVSYLIRVSHHAVFTHQSWILPLTASLCDMPYNAIATWFKMVYSVHTCVMITTLYRTGLSRGIITHHIPGKLCCYYYISLNLHQLILTFCWFSPFPFIFYCKIDFN